MGRKYCITTPAYYPNDVPHLGHAYTMVFADVVARWRRLMGDDVFFITGLDEHGSKIEKAAKESGKEPQAFVDTMAEKFLSTWELLNISYDGFIRTSEEKHMEVVRRIFQRIYENGDIYKGKYEGWYCVQCESYWTETQLVNGVCPECGRGVDKLEEENYFFKLSKYQDRLLKFYEETPGFIAPARRKREIVNRIKQGLKDLSISRAKVKWGIPVPIDSSSTLYVWLDALSFYLSVLGYPGHAYKKFWPADIQLMAKEILWFHSVIWPALLMSAGIPLPKRVYAHGWLTVDGEKMSKSKGNFIVPEDIVKKYGVDAFRYFLIREVPAGEDGDFSEKALIERINGELVSDLGNLVNRVVTLGEKFTGKIEGTDELSRRLEIEKIEKLMDSLELHHALDKIFAFVRECNRYVNKKEPWKLKGKELGHVLYNLAEGLRVIAILLYPFMPDACERIKEQLGIEELVHARFGKFTGKIKKGNLLFKKVETEQEKQRAQKAQERKERKAKEKSQA